MDKEQEKKPSPVSDEGSGRKMPSQSSSKWPRVDNRMAPDDAAWGKPYHLSVVNVMGANDTRPAPTSEWDPPRVKGIMHSWTSELDEKLWEKWDDKKKVKIFFKRSAEGIVTMPEKKKARIPNVTVPAIKTEMEELDISEDNTKPPEDTNDTEAPMVAVNYSTLALASTIKVVKDIDGKEELVEVALYDLTSDIMDLTDDMEESE